MGAKVAAEVERYREIDLGGPESLGTKLGIFQFILEGVRRE